ncbi:MAG TPA: hypothetical protein DIV41_07245, partial [Ruminococcaceae bacterium]|nr:hypothetical protein [Oscillospiraceae bacterium]
KASSATAAEPSKPVSNAEFNIDGSILASYKSSGGSVTIPDGVTEIGTDAFECSSVSDVKIPESVTKIDDGAFSGCSMLTEITIPKNVVRL